MLTRERVTSNITLSFYFKETLGELRNWVWSLGKVGVVEHNSPVGNSPFSHTHYIGLDTDEEDQ
jgi:hypothetical protein